MAIGWLSVLKLVPWGDVIENAPKVAQGAKKLWNSVGKKPAVVPVAVQTGSAEAAPTLASLQTRVAELQAAVADLHQQMLQSTELIQSLAEQNTQLVKRVEVNRKRVVWLAGAVLALAVLAISQYF